MTKVYDSSSAIAALPLKQLGGAPRSQLPPPTLATSSWKCDKELTRHNIVLEYGGDAYHHFVWRIWISILGRLRIVKTFCNHHGPPCPFSVLDEDIQIETETHPRNKILSLWKYRHFSMSTKPSFNCSLVSNLNTPPYLFPLLLLVGSKEWDTKSLPLVCRAMEP